MAGHSNELLSPQDAAFLAAEGPNTPMHLVRHTALAHPGDASSWKRGVARVKASKDTTVAGALRRFLLRRRDDLERAFAELASL